MSFHDFIPFEFARKCRSLDDFERWKATEFMQFQLYFSIVFLKDNISNNVYQHFMLYFVAIFCLASPNLCQLYADYAKDLLVSFVSNAATIYGEDFLVFNVHSLIHLVEDVKSFGCLDNFSAFPFENFLGSLKKMIRKPELPLQQIINRYEETSRSSQDIFQNECDTSKNLEIKKTSYNGPLPYGFISENVVHFKKFHHSNGFLLTIHDGDNCVKVGEPFFMFD